MNFFVLRVFFVLALAVNFALTKDTFNSCNRYSSFGYGYRDFFEVQDVNLTSNQVFYLEFYVKTVSNAHILLKSDVTGDDGFEIVIGGGSNTFSQIRVLGTEGKNTAITQKTENMLSDLDYRQFWISMDRLGVISVGKKDDDEVFVNWRFDNPFPIKYFSFGSWTNVKADWRFGCKKTKDSDTAEVSGTMAPLQRLKRDLFTLYDPNALPVEKYKTLQVKINFRVSNVQLDEKRGELTLHGHGDLKWTDAKIRWKPENYEGIDAIYVPPFQIWTPNIRVLNALAIDKSPLFDLSAAGVMVSHDGSVFWRPPFKSISSCSANLKYWPIDSQNCSVYFGFWMEPRNLVLSVMDEYETLTEDKGSSKWEIMEVIPFNSDHDDEDNYGILYVEVKRMQGHQVLLFTVPYIAALAMSLSSFWLSLTNSVKLHLSCGSLVVLFIILLLLGDSLPAMTENVPRIVHLYSWTSVAACAPIILFVILKHIQSLAKTPEGISKLINHELFDLVCCLPEKPEILTEYAQLSDQKNIRWKNKLDSLRLATIIERIFFFVYLLFFVFLHVFL